MANPEHVEIARRGAIAIAEWQKANIEVPFDLRGADLQRARLRGSNLSSANMAGANLRKAELQFVNLSGANLIGADLDMAKLYSASFVRTRLTNGATLRRADLSFAKLFETDLQEADLSEALLNRAVFVRCNMESVNMTSVNCRYSTFAEMDLSNVRFLETVKHSAPSSIGIDTLCRSNGEIPEEFLRGCGVPDELIEFSRSLIAKPFQFYTCFISFTDADDAFSKGLYDDLQAKGIRCWRWKEDAKWGSTLIREVDQAIRHYDKLIVIVSKNSLKAEPVIREIERALQKEQRERKEVLFPIRLDDSIFKWEHELQVDITRKNIGDFRNWSNPAEYKEALDRLVKDLRADA